MGGMMTDNDISFSELFGKNLVDNIKQLSKENSLSKDLYRVLCGQKSLKTRLPISECYDETNSEQLLAFFQSWVAVFSKSRFETKTDFDFQTRLIKILGFQLFRKDISDRTKEVIFIVMCLVDELCSHQFVSERDDQYGCLENMQQVRSQLRGTVQLLDSLF